jgi:hypothetical protein
MLALRRLVPPFAFMALMVARGAAAEPVEIRAAAHDGFGRIAFAWPAPVRYAAHLAGETLTIRFSRRLDGSAAALKGALGAYVADAEIAGQGKIFVAHLKRPMAFKAFMVKDKTVVVDLTPRAPAAAKPARQEATAKPATEAEKSAPLPVRMSVEAKGDIARVTFAWPRRVKYEFSHKGDSARLWFHAAGTIDAGALARALPALAPTLEAESDGTLITMTIPKGVRLKQTRRGNAITLAATGTPAHPPAAAPAPHAPDPAPAAAPAPVAAVPPPPSAPTAAAAAPPPAPVAATAPPAPSVPQPPPASVAVHFTPGDNGASLSFDWPVATGAAIFPHGGAIWIVFAVPTALNLDDPLAHGQQAFGAMAQMPDKDATVLRLTPHGGLEPSVRRSGTAWIIDFKPQPSQPDAPIELEAHPDAVPANAIFLVHQASTPLRLTEPDFGGALYVVPVGELGRGVAQPPQGVDFRALPSVQGIVIRPIADDLAVRVSGDGVNVSRPGGLLLSNAGDRLLGHVPKQAHALFDFTGWLGPPGDDGFAVRRSALERAIAAAPREGRSPPRLALAHFYFANLFGAETLAVLDAIGHDDAQTAAEPAVRALKGAACLLVEDRKCAATELGQKSLDGEPEALLWRAALAGENGDWDNAAHDFLASVSFLTSYPQALRAKFALEAAQAMLETRRTNLAGPLIDLVLNDHPARGDEAMALYLKGRQAQSEARLDDALALWDKAAALNDPPSRARALYDRAIALYDAKRATGADTVKALDALRFAWRGGQFEFTLLRRLGTLKLAEGDQAGGLEAWQQATTYFPNQPAAKDVAKATGDAFAKLFLGPHGDDLSPLKSLVLYDRFHDLEPVGARRDEIVRKLIDRLVAVDLLDRASALLAQQVTTRLTGLDKARGTTQLALLRLLDHKPDAAMQALDIDVGSDLPADLVRQRQQLRARVTMEQGKPNDALALLSDDQSRDADRLRADIYWRGQDWKNAATTLARLAGPAPSDGKLSAETGRFVVSLAAALTLSNDRAALAKLRNSYEKAMSGTSYAAAFEVLAGSDDTGAGGDPGSLAGKVAQIGELQSFMSAYKQKLASSTLSTLN